MERNFNATMNLFAQQLPDETTAVYKKGTIWFWKDPIYGEKIANKTVVDGENNMRYSRYVIVIQEPSTIRNGVYVCPISTTSSHHMDVPITIHHPSIDVSNAFARVHYCFSAHTSCFERYLCTLSHKDMSLITFRLMQMIMDRPISEFIGSHLQQFYQFDQSMLSFNNNYANISYTPPRGG